MNNIPKIFFKEEELEKKYVNENLNIKIPTNQTQYTFDLEENYENFINNQFPTIEEKKKYFEYRNLWHKRAKNFDPGKFPLAVCAELVSTCNLSCSMCYTITEQFKNSVIGAQRMLPWTTLKKIVNECKELGVYSLLLSWRGEPTLYRDKDENGNEVSFPDAIKLARDAGILEITAITHGQLIDEEMAERIVDAEPSWISFSFDGIGENYNKIRTPTKFKGKENEYNAFEVVCSNIKRLVKIRDHAGKKRPQIRSNTIFPAVSKNINDYYQTLKDLGVDMITVNEMLDLRDGKPVEELIDSSWACQYPFQRLSVSSNGVILPCTGAHKEESGLVLGLYKGTEDKKLRNVDGSFQKGELKQWSLKDVWRSEKLNNIREMHKSGKRKFIEPGCRNCSHGVMKFGAKRLHQDWDAMTQSWKTNNRKG